MSLRVQNQPPFSILLPKVHQKHYTIKTAHICFVDTEQSTNINIHKRLYKNARYRSILPRLEIWNVQVTNDGEVLSERCEADVLAVLSPALIWNWGCVLSMASLLSDGFSDKANTKPFHTDQTHPCEIRPRCKWCECVCVSQRQRQRDWEHVHLWVCICVHSCVCMCWCVAIW